MSYDPPDSTQDLLQPAEENAAFNNVSEDDDMADNKISLHRDIQELASSSVNSRRNFSSAPPPDVEIIDVPDDLEESSAENGSVAAEKSSATTPRNRASPPIAILRTINHDVDQESGLDTLSSSRDSPSRSTTVSISENDTELYEQNGMPVASTSRGSVSSQSSSVSETTRRQRLTRLAQRTKEKNAKPTNSSSAYVPVLLGEAGKRRRQSQLLQLQMSAVHIFRDFTASSHRDLLSNFARNSSRKDVLSNGKDVSVGSLDIIPMIFTDFEVKEMETLAKKRRRVEISLPNYHRGELCRIRGIFHKRIVAECQNLCNQIGQEESSMPAHQPGDPIGQSHVVSLLKNIKSSADLSDPFLREIALAAATRHRKKGNLLLILLLLIANDFDGDAKNEAGDSMLKLALLTGDICLIDILLSRARLRDLDQEDSSALHIALKMWMTNRTHWDIVELVLSVDQTDASLLASTNRSTQTPLASCLSARDFDRDHLEQFIVAFGVQKIEEQATAPNANAWAPAFHFLHLLATFRRIDLLVFCLEHYNFDASRQDADGRTFLHILASLESLDHEDLHALAEVLRDQAALLSIVDKKDRTAADVACQCGHMELDALLTGLSVAADATKPTNEPGLLVEDLSNGTEPFPIRLFNDKNNRRLEDFVYIRKNLYLDDAPLVQSIDKHCKCSPGKCNTASCSCLMEGLQYSASGTIVPGSCSGTPIYECGTHCKCGLDCGSRVIQRGIRYPFEVYMTTMDGSRGWGVRCPRTIQAGEFVMEFVGLVVEMQTLLTRDPDNDYAMWLLADNYDSTTYQVDPSMCGNIARFLNHSCDPNLFPVRVHQSGDALDTGVVMAMFSVQVIAKNRELTWHYGDAYWERQRDRGIYCLCGTSKCKFSRKAAKAKKRTCPAADDDDNE